VEPDLVTRAAVYAFAVPLIVALVELAKRLGCPDRYAPLVAVALGLATAFGAVAAIAYPPQHPFITTLIGLGLGLGAAGLYSGGRSVLKV
jgi:ribose/xylose/arabinose/galactoside ABC-type transport system permease subunit